MPITSPTIKKSTNFTHIMGETKDNYIDTFFRCATDKEQICEEMVTDHMLAYIVSGEMVVYTQNKRVTLRKGEVVFMRRNHLANKIKQPTKKGEPFLGLFLHLNAPMLKRISSQIIIPDVPLSATLKESCLVYLPQHPFLTGLFQSLDQYFSSGQYPSKELVDAKLLEAVLVVLQLKPELSRLIFDILEPWKPDLTDFMNKNFTCDLSVEQFAHYTGRSLSSFKRDFSELFHETPSRWIIKRRLEEAYTLLKQEKVTPSEIYLKVGFKNFSHFSTAFKKQFGVSPSVI